MPEKIRQIEHALAEQGQGSSDFDLNPNVALPKGRTLREAAVLVPIMSRSGGLHVILTKRSSALKHHPGQIAFPGGKVDEGDASETHAALREAHEEIGLPQSAARVLGTLPSHETMTGFRITPIVAYVSEPFSFFPEPGEVDEVFTVPLNYVLAPEHFQIQGRRWRGAQRRYYTIPYGPYYIWGATARVLRGLADRVAA